MRFRDAFKEFLSETKNWSPRLIVSLVSFCFGIFSGVISAVLALPVDWDQFPVWMLIVVPIALLLFVLGHVYGIMVAYRVRQMTDLEQF